MPQAKTVIGIALIIAALALVGQANVGLSTTGAGSVTITNSQGVDTNGFPTYPPLSLSSDLNITFYASVNGLSSPTVTVRTGDWKTTLANVPLVLTTSTGGSTFGSVDLKPYPSPGSYVLTIDSAGSSQVWQYFSVAPASWNHYIVPAFLAIMGLLLLVTGRKKPAQKA